MKIDYPDLVYQFENGSIVKYKGKFNYINKQGFMLIDEDFDIASPFINGFACVVKNNKQSYLNKDFKLLGDRYFEFVYLKDDGSAMVYNNGKFNFYGSNWKLLSDEWFDFAYDFDESGKARFVINEKCGYIDKLGNKTYDKE